MAEMKPYSFWMFGTKEKILRENLEGDLERIFLAQGMKKVRLFRGRRYVGKNFEARLRRSKKNSNFYALACSLHGESISHLSYIRESIVSYIDGTEIIGYICGERKNLGMMNHGILVTEERKS